MSTIFILLLNTHKASISSGTPSSSSSASSSTAKPKPFLTGGATNESPPFSPTDSSSNPAPSASSTNDLSPSPTSSPSDSTSSIVSKELLNVLLKAHNDFRAIHQVDPLEWNDTLAESSNRWVDNCVYEHSGGKLLEGGYGENLLAVWSDALKEDSPVDGKSGVDAWNSEISMYTYDPPTGFTHETGHVTQTIWKGTKTVGCQYKNCLGLMKGGQWGSYLVCQYYPPGNWEGQYKENVLPPKED
ncbi:uncharacterized protein JCM6883_003885 [Sporobolomyces salmoneus]|uniref:uncharacterized protein n=1 Tax=Sporobolomyces salmoneus TaxID=183962 RepID=UPI00317E2D1E